MKLSILAAALVCACSPAPTQQTIEITPLPTHAAPPSTPPPIHHRPHPSASSADDRDGDGIPDDLDKCPDEPEDRDGFQDDDGCPDPDNDQDGIRDVDDQCPNNPGPPPSGCPHP